MDSELKSPYKISLDFYIRKIITVNAKQLDTNSRIINITCTENGKKIILDPSTTSAFVRYKKSDGYAVLNEVDILTDGTVNLELSQQMLAVEGRQVVDIMLINGSELTTETVESILNAETMDGISVLSTMSFYINTEGCTIDGVDIESSYEYNAMINGLGKMVAVDNRMSVLEQTINENETQRQTNEQTRKENETSRQNAEIQRVISEDTRINAELLRETRIQSTIEECIQKTNDNIEEYTKQMNIIVEDSENAVSNANSAANNATQAGEECEKIVEKYESLDFEKIDEILDYKVEITQAEYNALSDEEKNNGKIYFITDINEGGTASEVFYNNTESGLSSANIQNAIDEVVENTNVIFKNIKNDMSKISNPNLFINGNFQIWSNGESFDVYGVNNEEYYETICDRWQVTHYDTHNNYLVTKESNGIRFESDSEEPCYIFQQLDEETFNSLQGKTLTLSYSYTNDTGETVTDTREIIANSDLDIFTSKTRLGFTNGYILHWVKLEVGEVATPCIPDSKDAIICKMENESKWKDCTLTAIRNMVYNGLVKYRYNDTFIEIVLNGTYYLNSEEINSPTAMLQISGLDASIPESVNSIWWNDTINTFIPVTLNTDGTVILGGGNISIPVNHWIGMNNSKFIAFY